MSPQGLPSPPWMLAPLEACGFTDEPDFHEQSSLFPKGHLPFNHSVWEIQVGVCLCLF